MKQILLLLFVTYSISIFSQSDSIKIKQLEKQISELKQNIEINKDRVWEIREKQEQLEKDFDEDNINIFTKYFELWMLLGTILGVFGIWIFSKEVIRERIKKELEKLSNRQIEHLNRILDTEQWAIDLRNKYKILIINKKDTELNKSLKDVLSLKIGKSGFNTEQRDINLFSEIDNDDIEKFDLFVIDNADIPDKAWKYDQTFKKGLLDFTKKVNDKKKGVFYFSNIRTAYFPSDDKKIYPKIEYKILISYANAHSQIYPNIMNLIKLIDLLQMK